MKSVVVPIALFVFTVVVIGQTAQRPSSREGGEQRNLTFRAEIEYVEVDVVVTDEQGNPVRDLSVKDFELLENGRPHSIDVFVPVDLPFARRRSGAAAGVPLPEPDVRSNGPNLGGRLYVIVLDDLNTHVTRTQRVKQAARQFIEQHLADDDFAGLIFTSGTADTSQELTIGRQRLLAAVDGFVGKKLLSSTLERLQTYPSEKSRAARLEAPLSSVADRLDPARAFRARQTFDALRGVGEHLTGVQGRRKSIVYISEGVDYDFYDLVGENLSDSAAGPRSNASEVFSAAQDALATIARAGAAIYAVDPRGLTQLGAESIEFKEIATEAALNIGPATLRNELRVSQDTLRVLAQETGGFAVVNDNEYLDAFARIRQENSRYYLLGYRPTNPRRAGRFNKIEVRVGRPGVSVRSRRGYMVPRARQALARRAAEASAGTSPELLESLKSPVPLDGLALSATAVPFRDAGSQASVAVILQLDPRSLAFTQRDDRFTNVIEVSYLAVDHAGKARVGKREEMTLNLRPETRDHALREGIRIVSRISLPPGRYQLRIGAREANGGRIGSVLYDLDVPNFTAEPLGISGILIASQRTVQIPTPQPDSAFDRELMVQPTTVRVFAADDILRVAAPLHVNGPAARSPVEVETTLNAEDGGVVFRGQETYQGDDATRGYLHVVHIPLIRLVPGTYVIRIGAKARMGVEAPVARELPITVAPQN